jgi:hypothetical protein
MKVKGSMAGIILGGLLGIPLDGMQTWFMLASRRKLLSKQTDTYELTCRHFKTLYQLFSSKKQKQKQNTTKLSLSAYSPRELRYLEFSSITGS